jgi:hypothetical protein
LKWASFGIYFNHGQCCCAGSRILVQESIYEEFLARFKERSEQNKVGDPFDPQTFQGPQVSQLQFDRIMGYIQDGKQAGARVVTGGERLGDKGYFIKPTIFADVNGDMKIVQEEIFGPVCTVQKFKTEEEAIKLANSTNYGKCIQPPSWFTPANLMHRSCLCCPHQERQYRNSCIKRHQGWKRLGQQLQYDLSPGTIRWLQGIGSWP